MSNKKQTVSIRLKQSDMQKVEQLAGRLNAKNSDVIRYAIKITLNNLIALHDAGLSGRRLLPMIIDHCCDLCRYFDIDVDQLEKIINSGSKGEDEIVQRSDIELLSLCGLPPDHIQFRFQEVTGQRATIDEIPDLLKEYLINKYASSINIKNNEDKF